MTIVPFCDLFGAYTCTDFLENILESWPIATLRLLQNLSYFVHSRCKQLEVKMYQHVSISREEHM